MKKEQFLIFDGNAIVHRAFHALPPTLKTRDGVMVNAVYGFTLVLLKVLKEFKPEYVVMTFDTAAPTFRHKKYPEYKATREKKPQELYDQFPIIRQVVEAFNIPIYSKDGFEADDLIGTITKAFDPRENLDTLIVTGDLDILQLVDKNTKVVAMKSGVRDTVVYDEAAVMTRYGLRPDQMIDFKSMVGDKSDNIKGIPGIGEKTASALLGQYGTMEGIYEHLEELKPGQQKKLAEYKKEGELARWLVTIKQDVPLDFNIQEAHLKPLDREKVIPLFQDLSFNSLLPNLQSLPNAQKEDAASTISRKTDNLESAHNYKLVDTPKAMNAFLKEANKQSLICFDTETNSLDALSAKLSGIAFSWKPGEGYYVLAEFLTEMEPLLENPEIKKIGHNLKYDIQVLRTAGVTVQGLHFDTMIGSYLLNPGSRQHGLDRVVFTELGHEMMSYTELAGKGKQQVALFEIDIKKMSLYAAEDADYTFRLYQHLEKQLQDKGMMPLLDEVEMPLVSILADIERAGIKLDVDFLEKMSKTLRKKIGELEARAHELAGEPFNLSSPKQLQEILFEKLELSTNNIKRTKTGYSTAASELEKMRGKHEIIDIISQYREYEKLRGTYVDALPELVHKSTGRVHTSFNQTVTATGRLSSSDPNLQNIPIRSELGREIRKAFIAEEDHVLLAADYSQIQLRIAAAIAQDENMMEAFKKGEDIHTHTAAEVLGLKEEEVTKDQRRQAKAINFGVLYGMGPMALARDADISFDEAQNFIDAYFATHPGIATYLEETKEIAKKLGYVETLFGRRRLVPDINSGIPQVRSAAERMAINMPIQGTEADLLKMAMIELTGLLPDKFPNVRMLLQVHDELVFEVPKEEVGPVAEFIRETMENVHTFEIPIIVDVAAGRSWGELEPIER